MSTESWAGARKGLRTGAEEIHDLRVFADNLSKGKNFPADATLEKVACARAAGHAAVHRRAAWMLRCRTPTLAAVLVMPTVVSVEKISRRLIVVGGHVEPHTMTYVCNCVAFVSYFNFVDSSCNDWFNCMTLVAERLRQARRGQ